MSVIANLTGFNIGYNFTPTLSDTVKVVSDPANTKAVEYAWVIPQATGTIAGLDLQGNALTAVFVAKDLNLVFPIPFTQFRVTGLVYTGPITSLTLSVAGTTYAAASGVSLTGGTGSGAKVNILTVDGITGAILTISLNTAGTGYTVGDILTVSGGDGAGRVVVANVSVSGKIIAVYPK